MKTRFLFLLLAFLPGLSQIDKDMATREISGLNSELSAFYTSAKIDRITSLYWDGLVYFPEYKPAILSKKQLSKFLSGWFRDKPVSAFSKTIAKIETGGNHVLEIGNFSITSSTSVYSGKYMVVWQQDNKGKLKILAEAFSADKYLESEQVPYASVTVENPGFPNQFQVPENLKAEVFQYNDQVIKEVVSGDGNARAAGFDPDGIYMPHFEKPLIGMQNLKPYMLETYKPGGSLFVRHSYYRMLDFGETVLVCGHFDGGWGKPDDGGRFSGNMLNYMKRSANGKLLMHCQLVNNDQKTVSFRPE